MLWVLITDRNVLIRHALTQLVSLCGCESVAVEGVNCALGALEKVSFDVLIAGVAPGDGEIPGLVYAARQQQPALSIILGKTYSSETLAPDLVNANVSFPLSLHELRTAPGTLRSAFD